MSVTIIDNFDSFTYNLYQMVQALTETPVTVYRNNAISFDQLVSQKPTHLIISPGPGHPGVASDFGICAKILLNQSQLNCPILGVCLGHQGIVHYLGGKVVQAPEIMHGKSSPITITHNSPLLEGLPNPFQAMRYHSLVAANEDFPKELCITAKESVHGLIMALQHQEKPIYGVQFHPESIGTPEGNQLLRNFLERC